MGRNKRIFDTEDISRLKKCHLQTVRQWVKRGILNPLDVKTRPFLFTREDVLRLPPVKIGRPRKNLIELEVR